MSVKRHIVCLYNKTTRETKNVKPKKTSTNQTNKRPLRPNSPPIHKSPINARLPNNNQDKKKFWCLLWPKHYIPAIITDGKERLPIK